MKLSLIVATSVATASATQDYSTALQAYRDACSNGCEWYSKSVLNKNESIKLTLVECVGSLALEGGACLIATNQLGLSMSRIEPFLMLIC